jgi:hypothetical protein
MKSLKTAFLLAAAATATQLDATDFNLIWSGASFFNGASATGVLSIDVPNAPAQPNVNGVIPSWITGFTITVIGGTSGNGTWTKSDFSSMIFDVSAPFDYTQPIHGQLTGMDDLNFFSGTAGVPNGSMVNTLMIASGERITLTGGSVGNAGVPDKAAWMSSINGANRTYMIGSSLAGLPLEGAHHRPMLSFDRMGKESQAWATGDFGSTSRTRDVHVTSGEAGINWNLGKSFLFGVAGGHAVQNQDLAFGGSSATGGDFAIAELDYRPEGTQWIVSLLGMVGSWESKTHRGYTSGGSTDSSFGIADTITRSARLRVDAPSLVTFGGFGFAPYASYTVTQTVVGAYTETGGAFPASFDEQEHNATEGRVGITASKDLSAATKLLLTVEAIHRFDGAGPALTGQDITGGVSFNLPGTAPRADCVRFGFDVDHKLSADTLLNISAHVSTVGEAHDVSAAISIRRAF